MDHIYAVGVGGANIDLCGRSYAPIEPCDSNPGEIEISAGGVTRNICDNLARLGADVKLVSAVGDDLFAQIICEQSAQAGIDVSHIYHTPGRSSSMYLAILDNSGDMHVALSDMHVLQNLPLDYLERKRELIANAAVVVTDPCMKAERFERVLSYCRPGQIVCVDPVSTAYARALIPYIGQIHTVKPNRLELEILAGQPVDTDARLESACETLLKRGVQRVFVSLGAEGCFYMDAAGRRFRRKLRPVTNMVNASGAGDAFTGAMLYATMRGMTPEEILDYALAAGIAAISHRNTINPEMSPTLIQTILEEYRYES